MSLPLSISLVSLTMLLCLLGTSSPAVAQHYSVRTMTLGRATQSWRIDGAIRADRPLIQGLEVYGYDLTGSQTGALSARAALRYRADLSRDGLSLPGQRELRVDGLAIDLFYVRFRPSSHISLLAGRHWKTGPLGILDLDGITATGSLGHRETLSLGVDAFAGRKPLAATGLLASPNLDIQGLPTSPIQEQTFWLAGAQLNLQRDSLFSLSTAYMRRWNTASLEPGTPAQTLLSSEQLGGAFTLNPLESVLLTSTTLYHPTLRRFERIEARADAKLPIDLVAITGSLGLGRWQPVFDLSSIFNLFDPQPHDDLYTTWNVQLSESHLLNLRLWARDYGTEDGSPPDRALGTGLFYQMKFNLLELPWRWRSTLSYQQAARVIGGDQSLIDSSLEASLFEGNLIVHGRVIGLQVQREHHRLKDEQALSGLLGLEGFFLDHSSFKLLYEQRQSTNDIASSSIWALVRMEFYR